MFPANTIDKDIISVSFGSFWTECQKFNKRSILHHTRMYAILCKLGSVISRLSFNIVAPNPPTQITKLVKYSCTESV